MNTDCPRTLVTGASGYVGGQIVRHLLARGESVRAFGRRPLELPLDPDARQRLEWFGGDIRDLDAVLTAARGVELIINCVGVFRSAGHRDQHYFDVHVGGARTLAAAMGETGVKRLVYLSTVGVHGNVLEIPCRETTPFNPGDPYQRSKVASEAVMEEARREGLDIVIVRPAPIYGVGDLRHLKIVRAVQRGVFRMFGKGTALWHPIYISDLVDGIVQAAESPAAAGQTYILAGPEMVTLNEWVEQIARCVGRKPPSWRLPYWPLLAASWLAEKVCVPLHIDPPLHVRRARFFVNERAFTSDKAAADFGFAPAVTIAAGLEMLCRYYRERGFIP